MRVQMLKPGSSPPALVSVDIPSGWHVENGDEHGNGMYICIPPSSRKAKCYQSPAYCMTLHAAEVLHAAYSSPALSPFRRHKTPGTITPGAPSVFGKVQADWGL